MIAAVARQEMRALLRDGRLLGLGLALAVLLLAVVFTASREQRAAEAERLQVEQQVRAQWDHQGERNPHRAAHFGLYAFKPRSALSAVEPGVDPQAGQALWLEPHKRNLGLFAAAADAPPSLGLGGFTPAFVLLALLPLLVVVLGHATVAQERESGILRMLQAGGMRGPSWLIGKWLGLVVGLGLLLAPALLLAAWLSVGASPERTAAAWLGLALLVYLGIWAAITVLVSAGARTARGALLLLVALWLGAVFVLPRLSAAVVERLVPLPAGADFWAAIHHDVEHGLPGDPPAAQRMKDFDARLLADAGVQRLDQLPYGANARRRLYRDAYATRVHTLHFDRLWQRREQQQRLLRGLTALTPYPAMRAIASALAQTDLAHRRHFEEAAEGYRQAFTTWIDEWDLQATRGVTSFESRYAGNAQWQALPRWTYAAPGTGLALRSAAPDAALLLGWCILAVAALGLRGRRLAP